MAAGTRTGAGTMAAGVRTGAVTMVAEAGTTGVRAGILALHLPETFWRLRGPPNARGVPEKRSEVGTGAAGTGTEAWTMAVWAR